MGVMAEQNGSKNRVKLVKIERMEHLFRSKPRDFGYLIGQNLKNRTICGYRWMGADWVKIRLFSMML